MGCGPWVLAPELQVWWVPGRAWVKRPPLRSPVHLGTLLLPGPQPDPGSEVLVVRMKVS